MTMVVNADIQVLLDLLACPSCRGSLRREADGLRCNGCVRTYGWHEGVPVLLADRSADQRSPLGRLHYALLGHPRVYDLHQAHGGGSPIAAKVQKQLEGVGEATLLDIGGGTGMVGGIVPSTTRYVWLDNDRWKLRGLLAKQIDCYAVLGDAARLPFAGGSFDWTMMIEVSHHLPDEALLASLKEVARVTRDQFILVDALLGKRLRSKFLWQLDLGRFPRSEGDLVRHLETTFDVERIERFRVHHDHLLCICRPRRDRSVSSADREQSD